MGRTSISHLPHYRGGNQGCKKRNDLPRATRSATDSKLSGLTILSCSGLYSQMKNEETSFSIQIGCSSWHNSKLMRQASRLSEQQERLGKETLLLSDSVNDSLVAYQYNCKPGRGESNQLVSPVIWHHARQPRENTSQSFLKWINFLVYQSDCFWVYRGNKILLEIAGWYFLLAFNICLQPTLRHGPGPSRKPAHLGGGSGFCASGSDQAPFPH